MASAQCDGRYLLARRHLVAERNREELDEVSSISCHHVRDVIMSCHQSCHVMSHVSCDQVSNRRLSSMAGDVASGLAFLHDQK